MSRQYTASQFRGDQFLRFTPEEAQLIAEAEYEYSPHQAGRVPGRLSTLAPPVLSDRDAGGERTISTHRVHHLRLSGGGTLFFDEEWDEGEPPSSFTQYLLEFLLLLSGEAEVDEDEDEYDEEQDEDEEEDW